MKATLTPTESIKVFIGFLMLTIFLFGALIARDGLWWAFPQAVTMFLGVLWIASKTEEN